MGEVIKWPRHRLHRCGELNCMICNGGLASCETCGGGEGDLPTDCPGRWMTIDEMEAVYCGDMNYTRQRGWFACTEARGNGR